MKNVERKFGGIAANENETPTAQTAEVTPSAIAADCESIFGRRSKRVYADASIRTLAPKMFHTMQLANTDGVRKNGIRRRVNGARSMLK